MSQIMTFYQNVAERFGMDPRQFSDVNQLEEVLGEDEELRGMI